MNALKANRLDEALEYYIAAVGADRTLALFPPHKFTPRKILGFGAFGVTFLCDQFGLEVVVKSISLNRALGDSQEVVKRLAQEWTTLMSLSDPRIIRARDFDPNRQHNGEFRPYLLMEYFPGENLQEYCEQHPETFGLEKLEHTLKVALEIAKGLYAAHQKQVIHRDIKPANVLYRGDESGFDLRIIDFGLALPPQNMSEQSILMSQGAISSRQGSLLAHTVTGTLKYAPPEQLGKGGVVGAHSDVYSWAKTLHYMLFACTEQTRNFRELNLALQDFIYDCTEEQIQQRVTTIEQCIDTLSLQLTCTTEAPEEQSTHSERHSVLESVASLELSLHVDQQRAPTNGILSTRHVPLPNTTSSSQPIDDGCWIVNPNFDNDNLYYINDQQKISAQKHIPFNSKVIRTGNRDIWVLCPTNELVGMWGLWHITTNQERRLFEYPSDSQLYADGQGGVWIFCKTQEEDLYALWHVSKGGERKYYNYPQDSQITCDGKGGLYILCSTIVDGTSRSIIWHANRQYEKKCYNYPEGSKLAGDGQGGVWILCDTGGHQESEWKLWHMTEDYEKVYYKYPEDAILVGDCVGGCWILCDTDNDKGSGSRLWHINKQREKNITYIPSDAQLVSDGKGGLWVLCRSAGVQVVGEWGLWHIDSNYNESHRFDYPRNISLVGYEEY